jgi:TRAP transporter TAXI family solute receptor
MKKKISLLMTMVLALFLVLSACGESSQTGSSDAGQSDSSDAGTATSDDKKLAGQYVTVLTGGSSGVYFPLGGAMAKIFQDKLGATATSQSTGASAENAKKLNQKKAELGFLMGDTAADAYKGEDSFAESGAQENLRAVAALYPNYLQIVALKESGIEKITDLKGKAVAVGAPGSGTEISARRVLEAYGLSYEDVNEDFLSFSEGVEGIKNGTVDAVVISSGLPNSGILELATTKEVKIIEIEASIIEKLAEKYPAFFASSVPSGTYTGLDKEVSTIAVNNVLMTHKDVSEEMVYELTKAIFENVQVLKDTHNAAKNIALEDAQNGLPAPLHPGAEKYYKEVSK